jgi:hypothetical protein
MFATIKSAPVVTPIPPVGAPDKSAAGSCWGTVDISLKASSFTTRFGIH